MERISSYSRFPNGILESQRSRAVFNDLQLILGCDEIPSEGNVTYSSLDSDIIHVRNLMNMSQKLIVAGESPGKSVEFGAANNRRIN